MAIGEILRQTRQKIGLSLEDVEEATRIRKKYILALEENNFEVIPGSVYVRGFLRSYASFLQIDSERLVEEYNQIYENQPDETETVKEVPEIKKSRPPSGKYLIITAVVVLVGFFYLLSVTNEGLQQNKLSDNGTGNNRKITDNSQNQAANQGNKTPNLPDAGNGNANSMDVVLQVTDSACWMKITVDNQDAFEGMVWPGNVKTFKGEESIQLKLGNAGAVKVTVNGRDYGYLGGPGQVITRAFQVSNNEGPSAGG